MHVWCCLAVVQEFRESVESHHELVRELDRCGAHLLHFGRRQDAVYIKSLLISVKLRWKKLVRRVDDKGRGLVQAHREDKKVGGAFCATARYDK